MPELSHPRRAHERPRPGHHRGPRGDAIGLRRMRHRREPRQAVRQQPRGPHLRLRRRRAGQRLVRGLHRASTVSQNDGGGTRSRQGTHR